MCDIKKYSDIFQEINNLTQKDTIQLMLESPTQEERDFYEMIGNYLIQQKQKECIERDLF